MQENIASPYNIGAENRDSHMQQASLLATGRRKE